MKRHQPGIVLIRLLLLVWAATFFLTGAMHLAPYHPNYEELDRQLAQYGASARGIVTKTRSTGNNRSPDCEITVLFNTYTSTGIHDNQKLKAIGDQCQFEVNDRVTVRYLPTDTQQALIEEFNYDITMRDRISAGFALGLGTLITYGALSVAEKPQG